MTNKLKKYNSIETPILFLEENFEYKMIERIKKKHTHYNDNKIQKEISYLKKKISNKIF